MPGTYQYDVEIKSNIAKLLADMKKVQDRLDTVEEKKYEIDLNIDTKTLESAIKKLDKMLDSLGKGTDDFKQFENLSKELSDIVSEVQILSKAFGKIDDSGTKTLLSSIQGIDKSLSDLNQNILNIKQNMNGIGGNANGIDDFNSKLEESKKYVNEIRQAFMNIVGKASNRNELLNKFPELSEFKNRKSIDKARSFLDTDDWNDFLSTLPNAHKYLESIGYDFERIYKLSDEEIKWFKGLDSGTLLENGWSQNGIPSKSDYKEIRAAYQAAMKDAFQPENDTSKMAEIKDSTDAASQAKEDFVKANKDVQSSIDGSENPLKTEADLMDKIAKSARDAADAKKEFVEANKQVKASADGSNSANKKKDKYANAKKVSSDEFLDRYDEFLAAGNKVASQKGGTILGNSVNISYDVENELVKVSAKIKDVDGTWRSFSAKLSSDLQVFPTGFRTITKGINNLDNELANFGKDEVKTKETDEQVQKFKELLTAIDEYVTIKKRLANGKGLDSDEKDSKELLKTINEIMGKADGSATILSSKQLADAQDRLDKIDKTISDISQKGIQSRLDKLTSYDTKLDGYDSLSKKFGDDGWTSPDYVKNVEAVRNALSKYREELNKLKADPSLIDDKALAKLDEYEGSLKKAVTQVQSMTAAQKWYTQLSGQKALSKINQLVEQNSNMSKKAKDEIRAWYNQIASGNPSASLDVILGKVQAIVNAEIEAGRGGKSMWSAIKEKAWYGVAGAIGTYFGVNDIIQYGQQAVSTIVELDTALVDLKKTTSMSSSELENFYYDSNNVAKQMGVTTKEIIDQASAWSRLGYSSKEAATTMAELSSKFASISPGMTTDEAQEGLVSIMKAFDVDPENVETEIMDKINTLGNKFAENNQDVVEGLKRSSAAMAAMGQTFTDTAALFTGGMEILQDAESMGTALRTLSMRVRGYDEETEELSDDLVNVTGEVADLTKTAKDAQGVSLFTDASQKHYKSMVEYLGEISDRWDQISEKNQTELLQKLFGKNRANAGAAIIKNFDQVRSAIEEMDQSAGSSDREMSTIESKQYCSYVQKCA